jgi:hypothetical protein
MGFHLLIFLTLSSSAMRSTWANRLNLCILINPIMFSPFVNSLISWFLLILQLPSSDPYHLSRRNFINFTLPAPLYSCLFLLSVSSFL